MTTPSPPIPDFVIVGNVARDVTPDGWLPGGTAVYASAVARGLGRRVGLVTSATEDVVRAGVPEDVAVVRHPAAVSTSFENIYTAGSRVQYLRAAGEPAPAALVPEEWTAARVCLIGSVYHEVDAGVAARCRGIVGVCGQGYLRTVDLEQRVRALPATAWDAAPLLRHARVLFLSEEDIGPDGDAAVAAWAALAPILAITDGRNGARIHADGEWRHIPSLPAREIDPTGAGDAFAAGFLVALDEGAGPWQAARFGAATAALMVETIGAASPSRAEVARRLANPTPTPNP